MQNKSVVNIVSKVKFEDLYAHAAHSLFSIGTIVSLPPKQVPGPISRFQKFEVDVAKIRVSANQM